MNHSYYQPPNSNQHTSFNSQNGRTSFVPEDGSTNRANGTGPRHDQGDGSDVAVFVDFENIVYSTRNCLNVNPDFGVLMNWCRQFGRVVIARAYADWRRHAPTVSSILHNHDIDPVFVPSYQYGRTGNSHGSIKNSVDMHLCVDAMRVLYRYPHLNTFVLISGDRDFIPLVRALRMEGKMVIGIGVADTTSNYLGRAVDNFVFYQELVGRPLPARSSPAPDTTASAAPVEEVALVSPSGGALDSEVMTVPADGPSGPFDEGLWGSLLDDVDAASL
jgi:uncharacterized LabA/DUF88 family protein